MLLYIIRHGDPNYRDDCLTPKGKRQAEAVARRLAVHGLDEIYSSPMGRARETAQPTCELLNKTCMIEEWCSEQLAWDQLAGVNAAGNKNWCFSQQNTNYKNDDTINLYQGWETLECFQHVPGARIGYERIERDSDAFLKRLGYERQGCIYKILEPNDKRVAVFCHQGFGLTWLSQLLAIPPQIFWATFDLSLSSITILHFENHTNGLTTPKCLCLSDLSHIYEDRLPLDYNNRINI